MRKPAILAIPSTSKEVKAVSKNISHDKLSNNLNYII